MKKLIELIKTYKLEILIGLTVIFFFRSCSNSSKVSKLEKIEKQNITTIDSLRIAHKKVSLKFQRKLFKENIVKISASNG